MTRLNRSYVAREVYKICNSAHTLGIDDDLKLPELHSKWRNLPHYLLKVNIDVVLMELFKRLQGGIDAFKSPLMKSRPPERDEPLRVIDLFEHLKRRQQIAPSIEEKRKKNVEKEGGAKQVKAADGARNAWLAKQLPSAWARRGGRNGKGRRRPPNAIQIEGKD